MGFGILDLEFGVWDLGFGIRSTDLVLYNAVQIRLQGSRWGYECEEDQGGRRDHWKVTDDYLISKWQALNDKWATRRRRPGDQKPDQRNTKGNSWIADKIHGRREAGKHSRPKGNQQETNGNQTNLRIQHHEYTPSLVKYRYDTGRSSNDQDQFFLPSITKRSTPLLKTLTRSCPLTVTLHETARHGTDLTEYWVGTQASTPNRLAEYYNTCWPNPEWLYSTYFTLLCPTILLSSLGPSVQRCSIGTCSDWEWSRIQSSKWLALSFVSLSPWDHLQRWCSGGAALLQHVAFSCRLVRFCRSAGTTGRRYSLYLHRR